MNTTRPDRKTALAFLWVVLLGGSNSVAIRFSNMELPPFFGAALRLSCAALIFWVVFAVQGKSLPNKKDALVLLANGFVSIGMNFGLLYFGLQRVQASLGTLIIALGPLFTFFLAYLHGLETFRWRILLGGALAFAGIGVVVNGRWAEVFRLSHWRRWLSARFSAPRGM